MRTLTLFQKLPLITLAVCALLLTACKHTSAPSAFQYGLPNEHAFTAKFTVTKRTDSYCLNVQLTETHGDSAIDQLAVPEICIPKTNRSEHILSLWSKDSIPANKPLPFKSEPLPPGESGIEVRFKITANDTTEYTAIYREPSNGREHKWTGSNPLQK